MQILDDIFITHALQKKARHNFVGPFLMEILIHTSWYIVVRKLGPAQEAKVSTWQSI